MALNYDGEDVIENSGGTDYQVSKRFSTVLDTLPNSSVPKALVMLGLLTEEVTPVSGDLSHQQTIAAEVTDPPPADVPTETVEGIVWLLNEVRASIDDDRKNTIGTILSNAGLTAPSPGNADAVNTSGPEMRDSSEEVRHSTPIQNSTADEARNRSLSEKPYECEFCAKQFHKEKALMSHLITCDEKPDGARFSCDQCDKSYHSQYALDRHIERHHGNETSQDTVHRCSDCGSEFESAMDLLKHKTDHTEQSHTSTGSDTSSSSNKTQKRNDEYIARQDVGTVAHYNAEEGYGFISTSEVSDDVFFHISDVRGRSPTESDLLQYDIIETDRGYKATHITYQPRKQPSEDTFASTRTRWGDQ